jgi:hypothetical protein
MSPSSCTVCKLYSLLGGAGSAVHQAVRGKAVHGRLEAVLKPECRMACQRHLRNREAFVQNVGSRRQMFQHIGCSLD